MGWSRKCEKRGKHWLRAAALGVVFLWTAGSSLQAEAESSNTRLKTELERLYEENHF